MLMNNLILICDCGQIHTHYSTEAVRHDTGQTALPDAWLTEIRAG